MERYSTMLVIIFTVILVVSALYAILSPPCYDDDPSDRDIEDEE